MSDFSPTTGAGAWIVSHTGGAPTPSPSPNPHNSSMRNLPSSCNKPFQCGICYEYLSHSVDELDEHITKHKRDLADRIHNRAQSEADRREVVHMNQNHQPMLYYADGTHAGTQVQSYEYPTQSCNAQVPQLQEYRQHASDCKTASKYYAHHPTLLAHHRQLDQAPSTTITEIYPNDCAGRAEGNVASSSMQHEDYNESLVKRGRYEAHSFEREDHHHRHAARPDLNEENTADADPSTDHMKAGTEHGPVSFAEAQQGDHISYHELQPIKSAATRNGDRIVSVTGGFGSERGESANDHESNSAEASTVLDDSVKHSDVHSSRDSEGNDFDTEPTSPAGASSKGIETSGEGNPRCDNETFKSHESHPIKCNNFDVEQSERVPRTRRSTRVHTSRR